MFRVGVSETDPVAVGLDRAKQISAFPNESFRFDDTVVVIGVGPLGMCFLMKARMLGAGTIIAADLSDYRLNFAKRLGADHTVNAGKTSKGDRLQLVQDLTSGRGADMVIECAGVPEAVPEALEMMRVGLDLRDRSAERIGDRGDHVRGKAAAQLQVELVYREALGEYAGAGDAER